MRHLFKLVTPIYYSVPPRRVTDSLCCMFTASAVSSPHLIYGLCSSTAHRQTRSSWQDKVPYNEGYRNISIVFVAQKIVWMPTTRDVHTSVDVPHLGLQLFQLQVAKADGPALLSCLVLEGGSMRLMLPNLTSQNGILSLQCIALQGRMDFNPLAEFRTARSRAHGGPCTLYLLTDTLTRA